MPRSGKPRRGSLQFYPRKRARRIYPRIKWKSGDKAIPLGFAGYKAGMVQVQMKEGEKTVVKPATVIACAPLLVCGIRFYTRDEKGDLKTLGEIWAEVSEKVRKALERKLGKYKETKRFDYESHKEEVREIRLIVCTQPQVAGMHKIKPEVFEITIGGSVEEQWNYAKNVLGKEIKASDVLQEGKFYDVTAITKGKGFAGVVQRFGVKIKGRKEKKTMRHTGSVGPTTPRRVMWQVPMPGQLGFHQRTEYNKRLIAIKPGSEMNPKGGWCNYGIIKGGEAALIEGSVPGPKKRLIFITASRRGEKYSPVEVKRLVM